MQGLTTMVTRSDTYTLFTEGIRDITGVFTRYDKSPDTERPLAIGMKHLDFFSEAKELFIQKTNTILIILTLFWCYFFEIFNCCTDRNSSCNVWRPRFPAFWNTCLFIAIL
jgi:hypothetical protein